MAGIPGIQVTVRQAQVDLRLDQDIRGYKLCSALFPVFNSYFAFEIKQVLLMRMGQADMEARRQDQGSRRGGWRQGGTRESNGTSFNRHLPSCFQHQAPRWEMRRSATTALKELPL